MKKPSILFIAFVVLTVFLFSCSKNPATQQQSAADGQGKVMATVNGVPITEYDRLESIKRVARGAGVMPEAAQEAAQNVLETLVRDELIYQKSLQLGLDKNPEYQKKMQEIEAQLRAFRRQEMAALYQGHLKSKVEVTDGEARDYFAKNAPRLQTRFHVWQIFYKGNYPQIAKELQELKSGTPFEKVVGRRFPNLPAHIKAPWDIGYLHWNQIPQPWQDVLERLAPGQVSDIIKGPRERFWVIKLVDKTVDPKITFATEKETIMEMLRKQKIDALYDKMLSEMRAKSEIIFPKK